MGVSSLIRDITARQRAEAALRKEYERSKRYLDIAAVILLELDVQGRVLLANRYACSVLGRTANELIGCDWIDTCLPTRIRKEIREKFSALLNGDFSVIENPILSRSGEERLIEWRNRTLLDEEGRVIGTLSSGTDITDRQRALEALKAAEERMRFALEAASVGIWDMDYSSGVLHWSPILESQFGLDPGTFKGELDEWIERVHPEDRQAVRDAITLATTSSQDFSIVNRIVRPDGNVRWISGAGRIHLDRNGRLLRAIGISQDVTERKFAEEEFARLTAEIQLQRVRVFRATMNTVQDIVNNFLNGLLLVQTEIAGFVSDSTTALIEESIKNTSAQLNALANLETLTEKQMAVGVGIHIPEQHRPGNDR